MTNNRVMDERSQIRKLKKEIEHLQQLAYKDELTNLYNRRGFKEGTEKFLSELVWAKKHPDHRKSIFIKNFSIILFDIDDFKKINDSFGHQTGDSVLSRIGATMLENVRDIDLAGRWGGEEIILGLVGASEEDAFRMADRIREHIAKEKLQLDGETVNFTVSGGVASFDKADGFDDLFSHADKALYEAKNRGKNKVFKYSDIG